MNNEKKLLERISENAMAVIPVIGHCSGYANGVKEGYIKASDVYKIKNSILKERMEQIKKDVLGDNEIFIYPAGWDEEYWLQILAEFISEFSDDKINAKKVLQKFIMFCHDKFPQDKLAETRHQLKIIDNVIGMPPAERLQQEPKELELTVRFLYIFGRPHDIKAISKAETGSSINAILRELLKLRDEIKACMDSSKGCNILTLGKTGTGKSSLLNYLTGQEYFKAGTGKPITRKGIFPIQTIIENMRVTVYDSWGIEAGDKFDEWHDMLELEKQKHDLRQDVSEWFHAIIYCVQASGARIEDIDVNIINSFLEEGYHITVAITKADLCSEEDEAKLRKVLLDECRGLSENSVVGICSTSKQTRTGFSEPFGGKELKKEILDGYKETIVNRLPQRCIFLAENEINDFKNKMNHEINKMDIACWSNSHNEKFIEEECKKFLTEFNKTIFPAIVRDEFMKCATIGKSLSHIIEYKDDFFKPSNFFEDNDEWYETVGKTIFISIVAFPLMIYYSLFKSKINNDDRKKMNNSLNDFCNKIKENVKQQKEELRDKIKAVVCPATKVQ